MRIASILAALLIFCGVYADGRELQVRVTELDGGHGVEGATIEWDCAALKDQSVVTNPSGVATLTLPDSGVEWINLSAAKPGCVKVRLYWYGRQPGETPPPQLTLATEPAVRISGRVVDDDGRGIAGATVVTVVRKKYPGSEQHVSVQDPVTDADGRWTIDAVPASCDAIEQAAWSHLHLPSRGYYNEAPYEPRAKLYDGTATLTLHAGTRIEGVVRDEKGQPIADAKIFYNADRYVSNGFPPIKTDATGKFVLGIAAGTGASLLAEHAGFGPALKAVAVGHTPQAVELVLPPPHTLSGQIVDRDGKGIGDVRVWPRNWKGNDTLGVHLTTDAAGRFTWNDAPAEPVTAQISALGYTSKQDVELVAGGENRVQLVPPTNVNVAVLDAISGEAINDYTIRLGAVWRPNDRLVWQGDRINREARRDEHGLHYTFDHPADSYTIRVEAVGHYAAETPPIVPDGQGKQFKLKLERGESYEATVTMADGSPTGVGKAYFVDGYLSIENGDTPHFGELQSTLAADGKLVLPPMREKGLLVLLTDKGVGRWGVGEWESNRALKLQPWARVSGRILVGSTPLANASLSGTQFMDPNGMRPLVRWWYDIATDADGQFKLDHVWPGRLEISQHRSNRAPLREIGQQLGSIDVKAGAANDVQVGGRGRPVTGRLDLAFGNPKWMVRVAEAKSLSDPAAAVLNPQIADDGTFRLDDVPGGEYDLKILLNEWPPEQACGWGRSLGEYVAHFAVPPVPGGGYLDQRVELGSITSIPLPTDTLKAGDAAPAFELRDLHDQPLRLADYRGKFVLLDFWATWCAPCIAEVPHMKALRAAHASDPRLAIISLSEDELIEPLRRFVQAEAMDWPQAMLGSDSPLATQYGATAIPQTVLIDPEGRVIATGLRGDELSKAIDAALSGAKP